MKYTGGRLAITMISRFTRPLFRLGTDAVNYMEAFYDALETPRHPSLNEMTTSGSGNSYAEVKLSIETFGGLGRVDITPAVLGVDLRNVGDSLGEAPQAKEHLALCEATLRKVVNGVQLSERLLRAQVWMKCEGGVEAIEAFLSARGNSAFNLDGSRYAGLKKQFSMMFHTVDTEQGARISLKLEPSALPDYDLFVEFSHTAIGNDVVTQGVSEHFDTAEAEMMNLFGLVGLKSGIENASEV